MVREGWKHSESVQRGSFIGHKCQNMCPEPGVAHHHSICCTATFVALPSLVLVAFSHGLVTLMFVVNHYCIPPSSHLLHCHITYHFSLILMIFCGIQIGFCS